MGMAGREDVTPGWRPVIKWRLSSTNGKEVIVDKPLNHAVAVVDHAARATIA
jgi:hypothetical protein